MPQLRTASRQDPIIGRAPSSTPHPSLNFVRTFRQVQNTAWCTPVDMHLTEIPDYSRWYWASPTVSGNWNLQNVFQPVEIILIIENIAGKMVCHMGLSAIYTTPWNLLTLKSRYQPGTRLNKEMAFESFSRRTFFTGVCNGGLRVTNCCTDREVYMCEWSFTDID